MGLKSPTFTLPTVTSLVGFLLIQLVTILIVLSKSEVYTLQIGLNAFHGELTSQWNYVLSMTMVTLLPIAIIFAYLQKFITTGIASTGMK